MNTSVDTHVVICNKIFKQLLIFFIFESTVG